MITADMIVAHLVGDYILQSHWMATQKTKNSIAAAIHAFTYAIPFALITQNPAALAIIISTHFFIDRYGLARYLVWLKNGPILMVVVEPAAFSKPPFTRSAFGPFFYIFRRIIILWKPVTDTGYDDDVPKWLSTWLLIIVDNTIHIIINGLAIWLYS